MEGGINGVALFGTCGEGPSFSAAARLAATERLLRAGFDPGRLILGIGSASIAEMASLARAAGELGLAATLATPPFFFRQVEEEGVFAAYARLVEQSGTGAPPLLLYHIPGVAGVPVPPALAARLLVRLSGQDRGHQGQRRRVARDPGPPRAGARGEGPRRRRGAPRRRGRARRARHDLRPRQCGAPGDRPAGRRRARRRAPRSRRSRPGSRAGPSSRR